jgi:hypothetical protein
MQAGGVLKPHQEDPQGHPMAATWASKKEAATHLQTACGPAEEDKKTMRGGGRSKQNRGEQ